MMARGGRESSLYVTIEIMTKMAELKSVSGNHNENHNQLQQDICQKLLGRSFGLIRRLLAGPYFHAYGSAQ